MAARKPVAVLREIAMVNASKIPQAAKDTLIAQLQKELDMMLRQAELDLAPAKDKK